MDLQKGSPAKISLGEISEYFYLTTHDMAADIPGLNVYDPGIDRILRFEDLDQLKQYFKLETRPVIDYEAMTFTSDQTYGFGGSLSEWDQFIAQFNEEE